MSATTLNLPFKRFVAQVSTAPARSKSTYLALMEENLAALQKCPWKEAADVPAALADHDFTASTHLSSAYDAFKMTGNYSASTMTEIAYAGMAAYRFKIPDSASAVALSSISIPVSRDRYLKSGVRVVAVLSNSAAPSADWDVVRGSGGILLSAQLPQSAAYLLAGAPGADTLELAASSFAGLAETGHAYLWIYLTLEDYTEHWDMYSANEQRLYAIEGSAMLVGGSAEFTFAGEVAPDTPSSEQPIELFAGGDSPTWIQPLPTRNAGNTAPEVPADANVVEDLFTPQPESLVQPLTNKILFAFPTNSTQESSGPSAYKGRILVTIVGEAVSKIQYHLNWSDMAAFSDTGVMTEVSTDSNGFTLWKFEYETIPGSTDVLSDNQVTRLYLYTKITNATGYQREFVLGSSSRYSYTFYHYTPGQGIYSYQTSTFALDGSSPSGTTFTAFELLYYYLWLRFRNGVPVDADRCGSRDVSTRQSAASSITEVTQGSAWTVAVAGASYAVTDSSGAVAMQSSGGSVLGEWTLAYDGSTSMEFFDPSVAIWMSNQSLRDYGRAATLGDFSHAAAAFEAGTQPDNAELLGRLVRNSRRNSGGMLYLHPVSGALADELDALRPVPRFFRESSAPSQTTCQPGLSVWYKRPSSGSGYERKLAYKDGVVAITAITNPVFLQYTLLALRADTGSDGFSRLVLANVGSSPVVNGFDLRFAVWRSPAEEWDGSNNFALSAIVAAPCLYRADGADDVSWTVDCGGSAFPFGSRTVHARRLGVSPVVSGAIAANQEIAVPLSGALEEGDVLIIAPVVLGFADGVGAGSVYFGRQSDPSNATTGWARYTTDLGWFPEITIQ